MLLDDVLLRCRLKNNIKKWQLKYPSRLAKDIENYYEIEDTQQIIDFVFDLSKKCSFTKTGHRINKVHCKSIEDLVNQFGLESYARINSKRKSYLYENIRIDLDETDFDYRLGEIELMLDDQTNSHANIEQTIAKISELTSTLG